MDDRPVALAVVTSPFGVLVGRRVDGAPPWVFVGGKLEPGETPAVAAVREAREEADVVVTAGVEIGRRVHPRTGRLVVYVECVADSPEAAAVGIPGELVEVRWVDVDELETLMPDLFGPRPGAAPWRRLSSLAFGAVTYEADGHDELVGIAMSLGGPGFVDELQWSATEAAEVVCSWDGVGEEPPEYRQAWIASARRIVAVRRGSAGELAQRPPPRPLRNWPEWTCRSADAC